jgi:hypothetical protein
MANNTVTLNTGQQVTIQTDLRKIFIGNNKYDTASLTNGTGSAITYAQGTVMGRIASTNLIVPMTSAASDGSQIPVGILADNYTVAAGATQVMTYCVSGDVVSALVVLSGSDAMTTVVSGQTIYDRIGSFCVGIKLQKSTSQTTFDN